VIQASLWGSAGRTDSAEVLESFEVDYTPVGVAVAWLLALAELYSLPTLLQPARRGIGRRWRRAAPRRRLRILDPSAGSGVFGRAALAVFGGDALLVAVEPRESEREGLLDIYDHVHTGTLEGWLALVSASDERPAFDLVVTNPPFSAFESGWAWLDIRAAGLLAPGAIVAMVGLSQWGQGEASGEVIGRWCPDAQLRIGGRIAYRPKGSRRWVEIPRKRRTPGGPSHEWRENSTDTREYALWCWRNGLAASRAIAVFAGRRSTAKSWQTLQLEVLPPELREWKADAVPGTYAIDRLLVVRVANCINYRRAAA
jgi:hypothetical protein